MTRITTQQLAIRAAFLEAGRPLAPDEVLSLSQQSGCSLSLATVYRNLASLSEEGWLEVVSIPGTSSRYEGAGKPHHDYFHCDVCRKVYELEGCCVLPSMHVPTGFRAVRHEVIVHGSCSECR